MNDWREGRDVVNAEFTFEIDFEVSACKANSTKTFSIDYSEVMFLSALYGPKIPRN